ncbi:glutamyl-Q tRNA(Asp) synthetase [Malonomonas rubra DSM 5091]|uniref:Glutamyl-Q tRNA(Asp) synthetase n=1 Tax=Malonomonas rubra DSM 5091 TaxID=1122189 RepID=A0A1M6FBE6_MALRU|nr:glutamyl-Q tRNA(Asp) synthetase [Malonomonas rubra DSM 5091]
MRVEDLDPPRVVPGSADSILSLLERIGFEWDGPVIYQSQRFDRYAEIIDWLIERQFVFECSCSRRELIASAPHSGDDGPIYPGTCRSGPVGNRAEKSLRLRVVDEEVGWCDPVFGCLQQNLQQELGDFVLRRADGLYAYQLAVVVDDIDSAVTQVVRGADLLSSTPRQIYLYRCLQQRPPDYVHLPLALGADGEKLSKRHGQSGVVDELNCDRALWYAFSFLGQNPPSEMRGGSTRELLQWGLQNFDLDAVGASARPAPELV